MIPLVYFRASPTPVELKSLSDILLLSDAVLMAFNEQECGQHLEAFVNEGPTQCPCCIEKRMTTH